MTEAKDDFDDAFSESEADETVEAVEPEAVVSEATGEKEPPAPQEEDTVAAEEPLETVEPDTTPPVVDDAVTHGQLAALMSEREKRQGFEKANTELQAQLKQLQQAQQQAQVPQAPIDPLDNFEGFQAQQAQNATTQRMDMSEDMARMHHGNEIVDTMQTWWREQLNNPIMAAQFDQLRISRNPYQALIEQYNQHQLLADIAGDPAAYRERIIAEHLAGNTEGQVSTPAKPKTVPTSLAKGGGTVGEVTESDDDSFAAAFK